MWHKHSTGILSEYSHVSADSKPFQWTVRPVSSWEIRKHLELTAPAEGITHILITASFFDRDRDSLLNKSEEEMSFSSEKEGSFLFLDEEGRGKGQLGNPLFLASHNPNKN